MTFAFWLLVFTVVLGIGVACYEVGQVPQPEDRKRWS